MLLTKSSSAHATHTYQSNAPNASQSRSLSLSHSLKRIFFQPTTSPPQQQQQQQHNQHRPLSPLVSTVSHNPLMRSRSFGQNNHPTPNPKNTITTSIPIIKSPISDNDDSSFDNISRILHERFYNDLPSSSDISSASGDSSTDDEEHEENDPLNVGHQHYTTQTHHRNYHHTIAALPNATQKPSMRLLQNAFVTPSSRTVPHSRSSSPDSTPKTPPIVHIHPQQQQNNTLTWCTLSASTSLMGSQILEAAPSDESVRRRERERERKRHGKSLSIIILFIFIIRCALSSSCVDCKTNL